MTRVNPLVLDDLADFAPKTATDRQSRTVLPEVIETIAKENNFPSRQAVTPPAAPLTKQPRRYVTGRNQQINMKATAETIAKLYRLADELSVPLGEVLARAVDALDRELR
jgi:hypothetical protein